MRPLLQLSRIAALLLALAAVAGRPAPALAADGSPPSLARYVPKDGLVGYVEFDGLDAHADAWHKSAAYKALNETTLGALLEDLLRQMGDAPNPAAPVKLTGAELVTMVEHVFKSGFVIGIAPPPEEGATPSEPRGVIVLRDAARKDVRALFAKVMGASKGQAKIIAKGKRKLINVTDPGGASWCWWPEKDDLVITSPPADYADVVLETIDGKRANASDHPIRAALLKEEDGFPPVALAFADLSKIALPPEAAKAGLDGLKQVDFRWGFQGEALMSIVRLAAPAPRKGVLAVLDQPIFTAKDLPPLPAGLPGFTVLSLNPDKLYATLSGLAKDLGARDGETTDKAEAAFKETTRLQLREDILSQLGPKFAFFTQKPAGGAASVPIPGLPVAVEVPEITLILQVADGPKFAKTLDKLMTAANTQLKALGGPPLPPGEAAPPGGVPPLEFQKASAKEATYTLTPPPGTLPPGPLSETKPTVALGKSSLVIASTPAAARKVLKLELEGATAPGRWKAEGEFAAMVEKLPAKMMFLSVSDQRQTIPPLIANLPAILQAANARAMMAAPGPAGMPGGQGIPLKVDPSKVPKAEDLAKHLFPASFAVGIDDAGLRLMSRESIPSITSPATAGVLVALLLPATQSAREAARRAQCRNNLKQIALAMHNYHDTMGKLPPAAITSKGGKPLLSWRVAILPYIEQGDLYNRFKLDEPWDSPDNKKLIAEMPKTYLCPSVANPKPGTTTYMAITGKGAAFEGKEGLGFRDITDGTSQTLLVVESAEAVPWTKPDDLPIDADPARPLAKPGSKHPGGFIALFGDGSVKFLKSTLDPKTLRALMTRAGNEVIAPGDY